MNKSNENIEDLIESIERGADGAVEKLHDLVRHEVSLAAGAAFAMVVDKLRVNGLNLIEYGVQSEGEIHYRAPLTLEGERKTLVLALDIVITAGVIPGSEGE